MMNTICKDKLEYEKLFSSILLLFFQNRLKGKQHEGLITIWSELDPTKVMNQTYGESRLMWSLWDQSSDHMIQIITMIDVLCR